MTDTTTPRRRSRRRLGLLAGVAGGALLLGGTTYALWSDNALQSGGTISNGNLEVVPAGATTYWDTSADRTDVVVGATPITELDAHEIDDIASYSIVPGDTLEANYGFVVALEGDNLVAEVNLALAGGTAPPTGVSFTAQAYYDDGGTWTAVGTPTAVVPGAAPLPIALGLFQAANQPAGAVDGALPIITVASTTGVTTPNIAVIVTATFADVNNRVSAEATTALGDVTVTLEQTRDAGVGNFG